MSLTRGYVVLSARGCQTQRVPVVTGDDAIKAWESFRDVNGLGSSDLKRDSGNVCSADGTLVARVSYNGRLWTPEGTILQEASL